MQNNHTHSDEIKHKLGLDSADTHKISWMWYGLAALLVVAAAAYFIVSSKNKQTLKYITQTIQKRDLIVKVSATGNIEPTNTVDVGIEVSGTIAQVNADFNQHVKKGDILARIDTTKLESRVKNTQAALLVAKANLSERKVSLQDSKNELERGKKTFRYK